MATAHSPTPSLPGDIGLDPPGSGELPPGGCLRRRLVVLPLAALAGACAAPAPGLPPPPEAGRLWSWRVGDTWRYQVIDRFRKAPIGEAVDRVSASTDLVSIECQRGDQTFVSRCQPDGQILDDVFYDALHRFEQPQALWTPDQQTGSFTRGSYYRAGDDSRRLWWTCQTRATGWERMTTPAGTFDALRVERIIQLQHPDVFRVSNSRHERLWYAPAIGRWVVREWQGWYRWAGMRAGESLREDSIRHELMAWTRGA